MGRGGRGRRWGCSAGRVEVAEWLSLSGRTAGADVSVVELVGQGLVEHELWDWFGLGGIEGRSLVEEKVHLRRTTSG